VKKLVVDASVVLKWFVPEIHSAAAARILAAGADAKFHAALAATRLKGHVRWVGES